MYTRSLVLTLLVIMFSWLPAGASASQQTATLKYVGLTGDGTAIMILDQWIDNGTCSGNILEISSETANFKLYYQTALTAWLNDGPISFDFSGCSNDGRPSLKDGSKSDFLLAGKEGADPQTLILTF